MHTAIIISFDVSLSFVYLYFHTEESQITVSGVNGDEAAGVNITTTYFELGYRVNLITFVSYGPSFILQVCKQFKIVFINFPSNRDTTLILAQVKVAQQMHRIHEEV
jgi:hypothetical protein